MGNGKNVKKNFVVPETFAIFMPLMGGAGHFGAAFQKTFYLT
jgi:hypothetical protein